jgi:DNA-binding GntR family transcriptional regulator
MFEMLADIPQSLGLNDRVYEVLKGAITHHTLPAGHKLDVNQLAKRWGISRTPVNDAIQRLMIEGLVSVAPRRGTFVSSIDVQDILELMDIRLMFELRAAELVVGRIGVEELGRMRQLLQQMDELLSKRNVDYLAYSKLDLEMHALPILWTNNQKLYKLYQSQHFQWYMTRLGRSPAGKVEHWNIYKAYESGSLEAVKTAIARHIEAGKASVLELDKVKKN